MDTDNQQPANDVAEEVPLSLSYVMGYESFEEWEEVGKTLFATKENIQFWVGDWALAGEQLFGERYAQAISDYEAGTVNDCRWVANRYPPETRIYGVRWTNYRICSSIQDDYIRNDIIHRIQKHSFSTRQVATLKPYIKNYIEPIPNSVERITKYIGMIEHYANGGSLDVFFDLIDPELAKIEETENDDEGAENTTLREVVLNSQSENSVYSFNMLGKTWTVKIQIFSED